MEVKLEQVENVYASSLRIGELGPKVTDVKLEQLLNKYEPKSVTPSGMAIDVKFEQPLNTNTLMVVNWELEPKVTDVKLEQKLNKYESKSVTPSGMAIEVKPDD